MKYAKTDEGQQAFKTRSAALTPRQRAAFILFDGDKTLDEVLAMTKGVGVTAADVEHMLTAGLLMAVAEGAGASATASAPTVPMPLESAPLSNPPSPAPAPDADQTTSPHLTPAERFARAWPIATQITASLGLRGFRLNLAVEAAAGYEELRDLLPRIREAVGREKAMPLEQALKE